MSQASELLGARVAPHARVVGAVSAAHFVSHYYILLLAPLLPFVRADYGVSYTEIGIALAAFNVVTAALQAPAGFLVDRLGARLPLIGALAIGGSAFVIAGSVHSFWMLVAMFALAGVGNAFYHPADYTLLSQHVPAKNIGQAFSVHTFAGMLGSAVAPPTLLAMQSVWGWRGAFVGAGILGFAVAALLIAMRGNGTAAAPAPPERTETGAVGMRLLLSAPMLLNLLFFVLLAMMSGGIYNYSVVAFGALYGTPVATANAALTGNSCSCPRAACSPAGCWSAAPAGTAWWRRSRSLPWRCSRCCGGDRARRAGADRGHVGSRLLLRRDHALARHDRARSDPARLVRQGVRLRHHRL